MSSVFSMIVGHEDPLRRTVSASPTICGRTTSDVARLYELRDEV
jgi:hypothetical protein